MNFIDYSSILIVNDIEATLAELIPNYPMHSTRIIKNEEKRRVFNSSSNSYNQRSLYCYK